MAGSPNQITFIVSGKPQAAESVASAPPGAAVRSAVRVGARRGSSEVVRITAKVGEDVVRVHIANGPTLYLHPENALELMRAQAGGVPEAKRGGSQEELPDDEVIVPSQLAWRGLDSAANASATRGKPSLGDVVVDSIDIVTGALKGKLVNKAAGAVIEKFDGRVDAGVYALDRQSLGPLKGKQTVSRIGGADGPILVLVHGTFSDTAGTFGKLWQMHPGRVTELFGRYENQVYALDHPTLGSSPFANALTLVETLKPGTRLHLVTHSRGGLVAEALARVCGGLGTTAADVAMFAKKGYEQHRADLARLAKLVRDKEIAVERVVRVACPARGTLLASRRLDAYLSVFKWGLELAGVPVAPQFVDFIGDVARRRAQPEEFPGLESMMPGRPFTDWLNAAGDPIPGDLRVVAGDVQGDSVLSWLKTLLTDAFYWTDHDLVVQTRSMYGGAPRAEGGATFILDRGSKVNHFSYFANERTANLITRALIDDKPELFSAIGPLSWAGEDASGTRAGRAAALSRGADFSDRPAVFVLPGILGSHLKVDGKRVWLSVRFVNNLDRLAWTDDAKKQARIAADGPVGKSYDNLIEYLADTHEVVPFSYDWRRPIEDEARRLADEIEKALAARERSQQPVRIVAHSMGGLVARTMQLERPATWTRLMSRQGARFLMLGTPNSGSFAPMQVMSGDDTFGNLFTMVGSLFKGREARDLIAMMPGLLQLQAGLLNPMQDFGKRDTWEALARADEMKVDRRKAERSLWHKEKEQVEELEWGIPPQAALDKAVALRRRLDAQAEKLGAEFSGIVLVVGKAPTTPAGIGDFDGDVLYTDSPLGDGRVTLENALLRDVKTWQVDVVHGDLADAKKSFDGYLDLLTSGETTKLPPVNLLRATRGAAADPEPPTFTRSRPSRNQRADVPPSAMSDVFSAPAGRAGPEEGTGARVDIRVTNGNFKFVHAPMLIGHYQSLKLTGAEYVIDRLIGEKMSESLRLRRYPSAIGSSQVFANVRLSPDNPFALPRPEAVIVIGLGEEGALRTSELVDAVRLGVIAYSQRVVEHAKDTPSTFELASTLVGSGGITISAGTAAQAIARGVSEANRQLLAEGWPIVSRLQLIELYLDRAVEAVNALLTMGDADLQYVVVDPHVENGVGGLPRPAEPSYRGADYDFISIRQRLVPRDEARKPQKNHAIAEDEAPDAGETGPGRELEFTLSTRRAREKVSGASAQSLLVDELVKAGASDINQDPRIGRTLFKLLVPIEIEPFLAGSTSLQLQLDSETAAYPWEMLDTSGADADRRDDHVPWGIQTQLLRKLRTPEFRESPRSSLSGGVLVIGEPQCPETYPPLPGAATEAREVAKILGATALVNENSIAITNAVFDRSYAILHIAGHGDIVDGNGGIVLSSGMTFGAREVKAMRIVPDLAFVNCCHLGKFAGATDKTRPRIPTALPTFAANVAEELIKIGVHCVIAAGWAVDDDAATLFARTFYTHLLRGNRFIDAVGQARSLTHARFPQSNTWAAYQCYGDPDWRYGNAREAAPASRQRPSVASSRGLVLRLRTLVTRHRYDGMKAEDVRDDLQFLESNCKAEWLNLGNVAGGFGEAYGEIGDFEAAIGWYERAINAEDGSAGMRALEQSGNMKARLGERLWRTDPAQGRKLVAKAIELLEHVVATGKTMERLSLLGSAYKRLAKVVGARESTSALQRALKQYEEAEKLARSGNPAGLFYPALNCMSLEMRLAARRNEAIAGFDAGRIEAVRRSIDAAMRERPDFWGVVGAIELRIFEALAAGRLAGVLDSAIFDIRDVVERASSKKDWDSVFVQMRDTLDAWKETRDVRASERAAADELLAAIPCDEKTESAGTPVPAPGAARATKARAKAALKMKPKAKKKG
jgi:tetratricopeptide (TPR) repeat protein/pimeloyl-ACP methyl ester carboxylesterase